MPIMKAIYIEKFLNSSEEIEVSEVGKPGPEPDKILVKVAAAGVNYVDLLYVKGKHQHNRSHVKPPFILGIEFSGTVISAPSSSKFSPGDSVFGFGSGYAEYVSVDERALRAVPSHLSLSEAAGLAATAPVSYDALLNQGKLVKGETVLIHAAAGGLGLMAVQIAKAVGARVIATASSKEKLDAAKRFGADECINYVASPEWWTEVNKLTRGKGVDVVYESVGLVEKSLKCLKPKGRVLIIGFTGREGDLEKVAMNRVLLRQAHIIGYRLALADRVDPSEMDHIWDGLAELWNKGLLRPTVFSKRYVGLESTREALRDLNARKVWGKAVVLVDPSPATRL